MTIGIKCLEKDKYKLKLNKSFTTKVERLTTYDQIHEIGRQHYKIPSYYITFMANYTGKSIETTFLTAEKFAITQKEKKRPLHVYLYCPKSYGKLQIDLLLENVQESDNEEFEETATGNVEKRKICGFCGCSYLYVCIICNQNKEYESSLDADRSKDASPLHLLQDVPY